MLKVGLTGGIGSGKSAVSTLLASYGAVIIDADLVAREVVAPGSPGLAQVIREFGRDLLLPNGSLDRAGLGRLVFPDPTALATLNRIMHPLIRDRTLDLLDQAERSGAGVVIHDVALLVENRLASTYDVVVVVAADVETQLDRLVRLRGMDEGDAQARIAAQAPLADKLAVATYVVLNDGEVDELAPQVQALWRDLQTR